MTAELKQLLETLTDQLQTLAGTVDRLARLTGYEQTADRALVVAEDVRDAWVGWEGTE